MLDSINTKRKSDDFEEKIKEVYDKYCEMDIDEKYLELWNSFVELIEYIQQLIREMKCLLLKRLI